MAERLAKALMSFINVVCEESPPRPTLFANLTMLSSSPAGGSLCVAVSQYLLIGGL